MEKVLANGADSRSLEFFLGACNGLSKPEWKIKKVAPRDYSPYTLAEIQRYSKQIDKVAWLMRELNGNDRDEGSPAEYLMRRYSRSDSPKDIARSHLAHFFEKSPIVLRCYADSLEEWWRSKYHPPIIGAMSLEYLKSHFYIYCKLIAHTTYDNVATVLEAARIALSGEAADNSAERGADPQSLKTVVNRLKRNEPEAYLGMEESVKVYLQRKAEGKEQVPYVDAAGYTEKAAVPQVFRPLRPRRVVAKRVAAMRQR